MPKRCFVRFFSIHVMAGIVSLVVMNQETSAITNGDFGTGDLSGWTTESFDDDDNIAATPIGVIVESAGNFAELETVPYGGSESFFPVTILSQQLMLTGGVLEFDLGFDTVPDTGERTDPFAFLDSFEISLFDGTDSFTLALFDDFGLTSDPFGDVAGGGIGSLTHSASTHPLLSDHIEFSVNLAGFSSSDVAIEFTMLNGLDGFASIGRVGGVQVTVPPGGVIPEPLTATLSFIGVGGLGLSLLRRQKPVTG